jgi:enoyl-CoA hydratase/carnithine racemase
VENLILIDHHGPVVTVTMNRPDKLNAFTKGMWKRLGEVMRRLSDDNSIRCIVLRGAGDRAFSPGNDVSDFESVRSNSAQAKAYGEVITGTLDALRTCRHPTVALIKGICVGGGLEIAVTCDVRVCGASSRFGAPINKLGLVMGYAELDALIALADAPPHWRSCWKAASSGRPRQRRSALSPAWSMMPRSKTRRWRLPGASPKGLRWWPAGTRNSPRDWPKTAL